MPKAKKKISTLGQIIFIVFAVLVDILEAVLDLFVVGVVINRVIDIVVAVIFFGYALLKGLTIADDMKVYGSIIGTIAGEFIPGLDVAPFFTIDAWYITHSIKVKDKIRQEAMDEENKATKAEQERQDWIANYQQQQLMEAEEDVI